MSISSTGGAGIAVANNTNAVSVNGGSIGNTTGADFAISGGTGNVTYTGTITDDVGQLVSVASTTGGTKSFTGAITDGNDGDGSGIALTNNTRRDDHLLGWIDAFDRRQSGLRRDGRRHGLSDAEQHDDRQHHHDRRPGTALNVANTTIGASGLTFRSISANGAPNGIVLNTTGSSGGLTVTGNTSGNCGGQVANSGATVTAPVASDCSGGVIQNSTVLASC